MEHDVQLSRVDQRTAELREAFPGLKVMGPKAEEAKLPPLDMALTEGMNGGNDDAYTVPLDVPGHTLGHMAFHFPNAGVIFTADSLMAWGCGRVFEGTMEMMSRSLAKLRSLPASTKVWCGHEYTVNNLRFAKTVEPSNPEVERALHEAIATREAGQFTVPGQLGRELATNPFLRFDDPGVAAGRDPVAAFTAMREAKDSF